MESEVRLVNQLMANYLPIMLTPVAMTLVSPLAVRIAVA